MGIKIGLIYGQGVLMDGKIGVIIDLTLIDELYGK